MQHINLITRRGFMDRSMKIGMAAALGSLVNLPLVLKRALAEGSIGQNGKKLFFIFLRFGNDSLNSVIPIKDPAYVDTSGTQASNANWGVSAFRPTLVIPPDSLAGSLLPAYSETTGLADFFPSGTGTTGVFSYQKAIALRNGFAALHPNLKFLAPLYNTGKLAIVHRVGYPKQSRSHFDSQNYWENGSPNNNTVKDGILYRTMVERLNAQSNALNAVSIQSSLPLILRGSELALTNLSDVSRYSLLGVPANTSGETKATLATSNANLFAFPPKQNRDLLKLHFDNLVKTLPLFDQISTLLGTPYLDNENTDGDYPYNLFPTSNNTNGGYVRGGGVTSAAKYVVDTGAYTFFTNLKAAALVLNKTEATIAGTELGGFDTHQTQGKLTGTHPDLQKRIAWAIYGLWKYFTAHADQVDWSNLVVVTLSEFGRTSAENGDNGTDHGEAGVMYVAGGNVHGGTYGCSPSEAIPWVPGSVGVRSGSMFALPVNSATPNYLKRSIDYRSVLGEVIRDHLGATPAQLNKIIPGYANESVEHLAVGGQVAADTTDIRGELNLV
jgi:uncharacterized protein (DUF1501 family)